MEGSIQKLGGVKRYVQFLEISDDPELVAQYRKWHSEKYSWKEVRDGIRAVGILEMEIYILGSKLVMIVDAPADFLWDEAMARLATLPRQAEMGGFRFKVPGMSCRCPQRREMAADGADVQTVLNHSGFPYYRLRWESFGGIKNKV